MAKRRQDMQASKLTAFDIRTQADRRLVYVLEPVLYILLHGLIFLGHQHPLLLLIERLAQGLLCLLPRLEVEQLLFAILQGDLGHPGLVSFDRVTLALKNGAFAVTSTLRFA